MPRFGADTKAGLVPGLSFFRTSQAEINIRIALEVAGPLDRNALDR